MNRENPRWQRHDDLAFGRRPREELYNLARDPHQLRNVAADPAYAKVRARLEKRLPAEPKRIGDPRVTGDGLHLERPPLAGPPE